MHRFDYYDFELAEIEGSDDGWHIILASRITTAALKLLIQRQWNMAKELNTLKREVNALKEGK